MFILVMRILMKDNNLSFHSPQERAKMKQERKATMEKVQATCSQY